MVWLASPTTVRSSRSPEPRVEHPLLQRGDVLVFVDHEAAVPVPELLRDGRVVLDRGRGVQQQIVEVEQRGAVPVRLEPLVVVVDLGDGARVHRDVAAGPGDRVGVLLGGDQRRLGPLDLAGEVAHVIGAGLDGGLVGGLRHHRELAVEQLPAGVADHPRPEVLQLTPRGGVEGDGLHRGGRHPGLLTEGAQPAAHLPGRPGGERHRQHLTGRDMAAHHEVGDAPGDGAGLTGAGAGQHADRPAGREDGLALFVVEVAEQTVDGRHAVHHGRRSGSPDMRHARSAAVTAW